jgi:hypothetical protein
MTLLGRHNNTNYPHRNVWELHHGMQIPPKHAIHHIDGNHENNSPDNLRLMPLSYHQTLHITSRDPRSFEKMRQSKRGVRLSNTHKENISKAMQKKSPESRARNKGSKWIQDGTNSTLLKWGEPMPIGYMPGRIIIKAVKTREV